jgi:hypothetical protein
MAVTTGENIKNLGDALFSAVSSTEKTRVEASLVRRQVQYNVPLAADAALAETVVFAVPANLVNGIKIKAITISCFTAIAAHASNGRVVTVNKYAPTTPGSAVPISVWSTLTGQQGAIASLVPASMTLTAAATTVSAGACITLIVSDAGTSVIFDGCITIDYEEL